MIKPLSALLVPLMSLITGCATAVNTGVEVARGPIDMGMTILKAPIDLGVSIAKVPLEAGSSLARASSGMISAGSQAASVGGSTAMNVFFPGSPVAAQLLK